MAHFLTQCLFCFFAEDVGLLPKIGGGRLAVHDILRNNIRTKESILMGESDGKTFYEIQTASRSTYNMQTFDQALFDLYEAGKITYEDALRNADSLNDLRLQIKLHGKESKDRDLTTGIGHLDIV